MRQRVGGETRRGEESEAAIRRVERRGEEEERKRERETEGEGEREREKGADVSKECGALVAVSV